MQFILAWLLVMVGVVLIFFGFFFPPIAEIHPSVLTAFGEILTFAGAILGIDYRYRFKTYNLSQNEEMKKSMNNE